MLMLSYYNTTRQLPRVSQFYAGCWKLAELLRLLPAKHFYCALGRHCVSSWLCHFYRLLNEVGVAVSPDVASFRSHIIQHPLSANKFLRYVGRTCVIFLVWIMSYLMYELVYILTALITFARLNIYYFFCYFTLLCYLYFKGKHKSALPFFLSLLCASCDKVHHTIRKVLCCRWAETHFNLYRPWRLCPSLLNVQC